MIRVADPKVRVQSELNLETSRLTRNLPVFDEWGERLGANSFGSLVVVSLNELHLFCRINILSIKNHRSTHPRHHATFFVVIIIVESGFRAHRARNDTSSFYNAGTFKNRVLITLDRLSKFPAHD